MTQALHMGAPDEVKLPVMNRWVPATDFQNPKTLESLYKP